MPTIPPTPTPEPCTHSAPAWQAGKNYVSNQCVTTRYGSDYETCTTIHTAISAHLSTSSNAPRSTGGSSVWRSAGLDLCVMVPFYPPTPTNTPTPTVTPTKQPVTPAPTCNAIWSSGTVYAAGQKVAFNGTNYEAKWWTQGDNPGQSGEWGVWKPLGPCGVTPIPMNQFPRVALTRPAANGDDLSPGGDVYWPTTLSADASDLDGRVVKVEFFIDGRSVGVDTDPPFSVQADAYKSGQAYAVATDDRGAQTQSATVSFIWQLKGPPTPIPVTPTPPHITAATVTTWKNGATAAYTMVHDDYCAGDITTGFNQVVDPALTERGLVATFAAITGWCSPEQWTAAKTLIGHGHEIASHGRNHIVSSDPAWDMQAELVQSRQDIADHLDGYQASYFVWPQDTATQTALALLSSTPGYLGARAANRDLGNGTIEYGKAAGVNPSWFGPTFHVLWDVFTNAGEFSIYPGGGEILNQHVDAAIQQGGWSTRTMHGVGSGGWEPVPLARYLAHLDYVKAKVDANQLWVATASDVVKYRMARDACVPALQSDRLGLAFPAADAGCQKYATPLTLELTVDSTAPVLFKQAGQTLVAVPRGGNTYRVTASPLAGSITVSAQ